MVSLAGSGKTRITGAQDLVPLISDIWTKTLACRFQDNNFALTNLKDIGDTQLVMTVTLLLRIKNNKDLD